MNPYPKRQPMWTCGDCGTRNDPGRTTCSNAAAHRTGRKPRGPLTPRRPDQPDENGGKR